MELVLLEPQLEPDWDAYFDCRWRNLRSPWQQARGSECDELDSNKSNPTPDSLPIQHLLVKNDSAHVIAVGRIHHISACEAQIRYMAVDEQYRGQGIASKILRRLEAFSSARQVTSIILNARSSAQDFYSNRGYEVIGGGELLFNQIAHVKMRKCI